MRDADISCNNRPRSTHWCVPSSARVLVPTLALTASRCWASTSAPFDLGGLFVGVVVYLLGLLVLLGLALKFRNLWSVLLVVGYLGVAALGLIGAQGQVDEEQARSDQVLRESAVGEQANLDAFARYCQNRQRRVLATATVVPGAPVAHASLSVRMDPAFTGQIPEFNAGQIAIALQRERGRCGPTGLRFIEGVYSLSGAAQKVTGKSHRRFAACQPDQAGRGEEVEALQARYELVLGETASKAPVPWGADRGNWMSRSSVRILDRKTGQVLAEDTLHFLRHESGEAGCPEGTEQLAELVRDVFVPAGY
jgi:hypothetical protein